MESFKAILQKLINEPAVIAGVVVAALNANTVQSWEGYASAVLIALVRFVVTGPFSEVNPTAAKILDDGLNAVKVEIPAAPVPPTPPVAK